MVGTEELDELVSIAICTGWIAKEKPVSLMLIAKPECGKSALLMQYSKNKHVVTMGDFTAYGFCTRYIEELQAGHVKHLIIPDFINPISRGQDTVKTLIAFLNGLTEEGIIEIQTYAQQIKVKSGAPNACGLVTAITPGELKDKRHGWARMGFMSRLIPISYEYSSATRSKIHTSIANQEYHKYTPVLLDTIPDNPVTVELDPTLAKELIPISMDISARLVADETDKLYGFRKQKQLQTLVKGCAIYEGRDVCQAKDVDHIAALSEYISIKAKTI